MYIRGFFLLVCLISSLPVAIRAQATADELEQRRQTLERKNSVLVDDIATAAHGLKLPENRTFILSMAADLMWEHDEKRARNLFWDALNTLNLTVPPLPANFNTTKKSTKESEQRLAPYYTHFGLRRELLQKVARRDPQLALDLLRASRVTLPEAKGFRIPDDRELEQEIAAEAAARDPKRALQIARESLGKGLTFQLLDVLYRLNQINGELASKFAGEMIDKLQTQDLTNDFVGSRIAIDLVMTSRPPPDESERRWRSLNLERERRRQLIDIITNNALGLPAHPNLLSALGDILPEVQEFAPERLPLLQKKLAAFNQQMNKEQRGWDEHNRLVRAGSPEEMFTSANALDAEPRNSVQRQAITMAVMRHRTDQLRQLINEVDDESRRNGLIDALENEQMYYSIDKGDSDALRQLTSHARLREQRARAMAEVALLLEKKGNHDEAVKMLDEARTFIKVDFDSETQTNALLGLVAAYAIVDPPKAFAILEKTIDRANDQISKLLLLDRVIKTGVIKKGEVVLQKSGILPLDFFMFRFGKGVSALAEADFERTRAAADRLSRDELRLLARLMLARALVESTRKPARSDKRG